MRLCLGGTLSRRVGDRSEILWLSGNHQHNSCMHGVLVGIMGIMLTCMVCYLTGIYEFTGVVNSYSLTVLAHLTAALFMYILLRTIDKQFSDYLFIFSRTYAGLVARWISSPLMSVVMACVNLEHVMLFPCHSHDDVTQKGVSNLVILDLPYSYFGCLIEFATSYDVNDFNLLFLFDW